MSGKLTTHALDTGIGKPAAGLIVQLYRGVAPNPIELIHSTLTNENGRTGLPLLEGPAFVRGDYSLVFNVEAYHRMTGAADAGRFLKLVAIQFAIDDPAAHYHIPLLFSPWSYSTYRGS